jgi:broad specificity phosphatase PhoE
MSDLRAIEGDASFYFIRHGESEGNRAGLMQGRNPSTLTERGREQAREAGHWLRSRGIQVVLSSPLARAWETAEIISAEADIRDLRRIDALTEIDTGIFSSLTLAQAATRHPDAWNGFMTMSWEGVPGAERIESLISRAAKTWGTLIDLVGEEKRGILSVSHAGFIQWIIRWTFGSRTWMPLLGSSANCAISLLTVENRTLPSERSGFPRSFHANWTMINIPTSRADPVDGPKTDK